MALDWNGGCGAVVGGARMTGGAGSMGGAGDMRLLSASPSRLGAAILASVFTIIYILIY